jgi:hypothetical protein
LLSHFGRKMAQQNLQLKKQRFFGLLKQAQFFFEMGDKVGQFFALSISFLLFE